MIFIGADHRGWKVKEKIKEWLLENGETVTDLGAEKYDKDDDYPDYAIAVAEKTVAESGIGVVICGSGIGGAIAANKVSGARAGLCLLEKQVRWAREDDNINILVLSADLVPEDDNLEMVSLFLKTVFSSEERHIRRLKKIKNYEEK